VQVPEQVVVERGANANEALAVIDQKPDLELDAGQLRDRQPIDAFSQRGASDRQRVDAIGLAASATRPTLVGHQSRRNANDALAVDDQEPLERAGDVPAVLQRPDTFGSQAARPLKRRREAPLADVDRSVAAQLAGERGDRRDRV
jgi:hypothetical protein